MTIAETRGSYLSMLREHVCVIVFTKKNGEDRTMHCTLRKDLVPENPTFANQAAEVTPSPVKSIRKVNENIISVWDTEQLGWRSACVDSIKSITIKPA